MSVIVVEHKQTAFILPFSVFTLKCLADVLAHQARLNEIELILTSDNEISRQNYKFMGVKGPTNILSFPLEQGGCLLLSLDTLQRECRIYGQNLREYLCRMLAHGMAHLKGYDHGEAMAICEANLYEKGISFLVDHKF